VSEKLPYKTENHNLVADHDNEPAMSDVIENVSIPGSPPSVRANLSDKNIFQKNSIRQHISFISDKNSEEQQHKKTIF